MPKRFVVVFIALVVVALAAPALAAQRRTYFGPAAGGVNNAGVEISARLSNGEPYKVASFAWQNVPATCGTHRGATTGNLPKAIKVTARKFHATQKLNGGQTTVTVSGKFKHSDQRMAGTLRVQGGVPGCGAGDTGTVSWSAKQPAGQK